MSLISQDHTESWGPGGLIVEAPAENIVVTSSSDFGTDNNNLPDLLAVKAHQELLNGDELLSETQPDGHNEVVALAKQGTYPLQLKGFYYKTLPSGEPFNPYLAEHLQDQANRLNVPLIRIESEGYIKDDTIDEYDGILLIHRNGNQFRVPATPDKDIVVSDALLRPYAATPDEFLDTISFALQSGRLRQADAESLVQRYAAQDRARQTPRITFNTDGSVEKISYRTGYGQAEEEVHIDGAGRTHRFNVKDAFIRNQNRYLSKLPQV